MIIGGYSEIRNNARIHWLNLDDSEDSVSWKEWIQSQGGRLRLHAGMPPQRCDIEFINQEDAIVFALKYS